MMPRLLAPPRMGGAESTASKLLLVENPNNPPNPPNPSYYYYYYCREAGNEGIEKCHNDKCHRQEIRMSGMPTDVTHTHTTTCGGVSSCTTITSRTHALTTTTTPTDLTSLSTTTSSSFSSMGLLCSYTSSPPTTTTTSSSSSSTTFLQNPSLVVSSSTGETASHDANSGPGMEARKTTSILPSAPMMLAAGRGSMRLSSRLDAVCTDEELLVVLFRRYVISSKHMFLAFYLIALGMTIIGLAVLVVVFFAATKQSLDPLVEEEPPPMEPTWWVGGAVILVVIALGLIGKIGVSTIECPRRLPPPTRTNRRQDDGWDKEINGGRTRRQVLGSHQRMRSLKNNDSKNKTSSITRNDANHQDCVATKSWLSRLGSFFRKMPAADQDTITRNLFRNCYRKTTTALRSPSILSSSSSLHFSLPSIPLCSPSTYRSTFSTSQDEMPPPPLEEATRCSSGGAGPSSSSPLTPASVATTSARNKKVVRWHTEADYFYFHALSPTWSQPVQQMFQPSAQYNRQPTANQTPPQPLAMQYLQQPYDDQYSEIIKVRHVTPQSDQPPNHQHAAAQSQCPQPESRGTFAAAVHGVLKLPLAHSVYVGSSSSLVSSQSCSFDISTCQSPPSPSCPSASSCKSDVRKAKEKAERPRLLLPPEILRRGAEGGTRLLVGRCSAAEKITEVKADAQDGTKEVRRGSGGDEKENKENEEEEQTQWSIGLPT